MTLAASLKIAVVCTGTELLRGFTVNTNLSDIGTALLNTGLHIERASVVGDSAVEITETLKDFLSTGADIIIVTGGLGPTVDDITKESVSELFRMDLKEHPLIAESIRNYWCGRKRDMPEIVLVQALVPEGSEVFPNRVGTAPGLKITVPAEFRANLRNPHPELPCVILLPGPPSEMNPMLNEYVIPFISSLNSGAQTYIRTVCAAGIPESNVEAIVQPLISSREGIDAAYCASPESVKIYISGADACAVDSAEAEIRRKLVDYVLPDDCRSSMDAVMGICMKKDYSISVAESCTGGLITAGITDIPGVSEVFNGGIVCYSNNSKRDLLSVPAEIIEKYGAVSSECAGAMLSGLLKVFSSDAGISVTGIAGPGGGTEEKPVGLVYIGAFFRKQRVVKKCMFHGDRQRIRQRAVHTAFNILFRLMKS